MEDRGGLMIMTSHFDTLDYAQRLERAGVPKEQAAAQAQALQQGLAGLVCPHELASAEDGFQQKLELTEERLSGQIAQMRCDFQALRIELLARFDSADIERKYVRWVLGGLAALNIAVFVKLFNP